VADIFLGKITKWNDPAITSLNPGVNLPNAAIFVAHRSDASGTTFIFTDYLSKISPAWKAGPGNGKSISWPVGLGGKGNPGVAQLLKTHQNSIGYIELAYAKQNSIPYAQIQNASGAWLSPSADAGSLAAEGATIPDDFCASIVNSPNPKAYPITGLSWIIVYQQSGKADEIKKMLKWVLTTGQKDCGALDYAPIPDAVQKRELAAVDTIKSG